MRWMIMTWMFLAACDASANESEREARAGGDRDRATQESSAPCDWPQEFGTADHGGRACPEIRGMTVVAKISQDPDADAENDQGGFLQIHESPPLTLGDFLIVPTKSGFVSVDDRTPERYHVAAYRWTPSVTAPGRRLTATWTVDTDWRPIDAAIASFGFVTNGYVQQLGAAIANGSVYVPAAHGQLLRLSLETGQLQARVDPFAGSPIDGDDRLTVTNAPTVGADGTVYYATVAWPTDAQPFGRTPRGSYLVAVRPDGSTAVADWSPDNVVKIAGGGIAGPSVGVPTLADLCEYPFGTLGTPPASGPDSRPPLFRCGAQRPAMNAPIAISPLSGDLVAFSYANNARAAGFLIRIDPVTLAPLGTAADLRDGHLQYGCGVRLSLSFPGCDVVTAGGTVNLGNDPEFNGPVHLRTPADIMDDAPSISPDGSIQTVGSYDGGFGFEGVGGYDARGSMIAWNADGTFHANNPEFGWEVTESWRPTAPGGLGFVGLQDRNLYSLFDLGVAQYSSSFGLLDVGGPVVDPNAFPIDFVDAHIPFGVGGDHYGINAAGFVHKLSASGQVVESVALTNDDGSIRAMETESNYMARDRAGDLIVSFAGSVYVIASSGAPRAPTAAPASPSASLRTARAARLSAAARTPEPGPPTD